MTSLMDIFVTVKPDMDKFGPEVKKKLKSIDTSNEGKQVAGRFGVGFNGAFGGIVKHSAGLFVGAFAVIKSAQVFGSFINDARESAKVARVSAQVIKSTGGVAGITAKQIGDLATAISNKTGADDEAIQSGENLLATFTNVRNSVGKGNDIFSRATQAAVDMASAMNNGVVDANGLKAANIQLGKALNDPIKGVSALSKVGVSFTADQKKQIKTLVDSGNTLKAQKIILGEVGKEFGGAAAAAADPLTRLQTITGNLAEQVGGFLLPSVDKFATFIGDTAVPQISAFADAFAAKVLPKLQEFGGFVQTEVIPKLRDFAGFFQSEILPRLKDFADTIATKVVPFIATLVTNLATSLKPILVEVFGFIRDEVVPRLKEFGQWVGDNIVPRLADLATSLSKNKDFLIPFVATLGALGGIILTVVTAMKAWAVIQGILNVVLTANPIGLVVVAIALLVGGLIYAFKHSSKFREILQDAFKKIQQAAQVMAPLVKAAIDIVVGVFQLWWLITKPILTAFWTALKFAWARAQDFGRIVAGAFNAIKGPATAAFKFVIDKFLGFVENIITAAAKAFGWVPGIGPKLKTAAAEFKKFRDGVNNSLNGINDQTITVTAQLNSANMRNRVANDPRQRNALATGGGVFGAGTATSDSIPAMLSNGEHVWTAKEVQKAGGHGAMENMRKSVLAFASGGGVGVDVRTSNPVTFARGLAASARAMVRPAAQALANELHGLLGTMNFGRSQAGKPYVWGAVGPNGYDCSGFVSALINYAKGRNPYQRLGATGSMPWSDMTSGSGAFNVGWFKGNPGHTAATINGVNFESRGGRGVVVGAGARGANDSLFTSHAKVKGFAGGGRVGDLPYDLINPQGKAFQGRKFLQEIGIDNFDTGGPWKSGTLGVNLSGKTETVIPGDGLRLHPKDIEALADAIAQRPVLLDGHLVDAAMSRTALSGGY